VKVPFADLKVQYAKLKPEMDAAVHAVLDSSEFIGGHALRSFEAAFAKAHEAKHCIGVGNGTDAIVVALKCLGIGPGDTVATAANSFIATSEAITLAGALPLFVDCSDDYTLDVAALSRALERSKAAGRPVRAIIPVHLYGRTCDMTAIADLAKAHGCAVIEDSAQAHLAEHRGRPIGRFSTAATFSFYPGKNLGAYGDAGALVTNDDALAERMRMFANHGRKDKYDHVFEGTNSRLDNLQAAVLGVKLPHLRDWTRARIAAARGYRERLAGVPGVELPAQAEGFEHVYHLFVVRVADREAVRAQLKAEGVDTGVHYPSTLPNLPAYRHLETSRADFANANAFESTILSLPMFPEISDAQLDWVADCLRRAVRARA
jgi:dTDP-4-amino-4,6-dideoxygalactose transaminase